MTVFLVEQNAYHALRLAHRGYVMVNGLVTMTGTGQRTAGTPRNPRRLSGRRPALTRTPAHLLERTQGCPIGSTTQARTAFGVFAVVTIAIGGAAAWATGQAIAETWRPFWQLPLYVLPADLRRALPPHARCFDEPMLSARNFVVDALVMRRRRLCRPPHGARPHHGPPVSLARRRHGRGPLSSDAAQTRTLSAPIHAPRSCRPAHVAHRRAHRAQPSGDETG